MNPRLKIFLTVCGGILLFISAIAAIILSQCLLEILLCVLFEFLLAKTSSEALAVFGTLAIFLAACVACCGLHKLCSIFTEKITSSYQSFKNESSGDGIFSEVYNDPTIGLKDKILFFLYTQYTTFNYHFCIVHQRYQNLVECYQRVECSILEYV